MPILTCAAPRGPFAAFAAAALALLLATAAPARAQDKDPVVAKVNGAEIHQSDLAVAEEEPGNCRRCRRSRSRTISSSSPPT